MSKPFADEPVILGFAGFRVPLAKIVVDAVESDDRLTRRFVMAVLWRGISTFRHSTVLHEMCKNGNYRFYDLEKAALPNVGR